MAKVDLIDQLNKNLADVQVLYVKLHNYHWNIQGMQFFSIHNVTEEYYNFFAEQYDEIAERILQIKGKPLTTMKSYLEITGISEEDKKEFSASDVLKGVTADFEYLLGELKKTSKISEEWGDLSSQGLADELVAWLEKALWMLNANK